MGCNCKNGGTCTCGSNCTCCDCKNGGKCTCAPGTCTCCNCKAGGKCTCAPGQCKCSSGGCCGTSSSTTQARIVDNLPAILMILGAGLLIGYALGRK